jgi:hypothetical protein
MCALSSNPFTLPECPPHYTHYILSSLVCYPPHLLPSFPLFSPRKVKFNLVIANLFVENSIIMGFFFLQFWDIKNSTKFCKVSWNCNREKYIPTFFWNFLLRKQQQKLLEKNKYYYNIGCQITILLGWLYNLSSSPMTHVDNFCLYKGFFLLKKTQAPKPQMRLFDCWIRTMVCMWNWFFGLKSQYAYVYLHSWWAHHPCE